MRKREGGNEEDGVREGGEGRERGEVGKEFQRERKSGYARASARTSRK